jgi:hypothetical protein
LSDQEVTFEKKRFFALLIWVGLAAVIIVPIAIAASSPYLASRSAAYIVAGLAGTVCLSLFLVQPMLAADYLPGLRPTHGRKWHRRVGTAIVFCVVLHVGGLFLTSPPDTIDALLLIAPTSFSVFGVIAMWGVFLAAAQIFWLRKIGQRYPVWQILHNVTVLITVISTVIHAIQIQGTMGATSKTVLCVAVLVALTATLVDLRVLKPLLRSRANQKPDSKSQN